MPVKKHVVAISMRGAATKIVAAEQTYLSAKTSTLFCSVPPPVRNKRNRWNKSIGIIRHYSLSLVRTYKDSDSYDMLGHGPDLYLEPGALVRIKGEGRYLPIARVSSPEFLFIGLFVL